MKLNKYVKSYLHRGLIFGGFGCIVVGIVYAIVDACVDGVALGGWDMLVVILSGYVIAFVQAGSSVFNQIEHWPIAKSLAVHFASLYIVYCGAYVINTWIPFEPLMLLIFTASFVLIYFVVWLTVYLCVRLTSKRLSEKL